MRRLCLCCTSRSDDSARVLECLERLFESLESFGLGEALTQIDNHWGCVVGLPRCNWTNQLS